MERVKHLLLVDDDPHFVMLMGDFLEKRGFQVSRANDGRQGLEMAQRQNPDLIVCDIMMPHMNGYELVQQLREQPLQRVWTPVIFLSARGELIDRIKGLQEGADAYLVKPFEPDELIALIDSLIRRTQTTSSRLPLTNTLGPAASCSFDDLTPTEQRVLSLVVRGLANKLIAKEMKVSQRTVESHVSSILQKTSFTNRTELTRWTLENHYFDS
ncbi:response regulator transcription factor [Candidatus Cyanaurora vandensis]|uniref:response regulator transcription factor n=1 Tax=Candidatus Cyanaurora vandensis TaxID=2714958 RepID=UPI00257FBA6A|nr:response regulator transcription factor [Candidatus Cyanaurora vandensis]